jgi:hypothetical protein
MVRNIIVQRNDLTDARRLNEQEVLKVDEHKHKNISGAI